MRKILLVRHGIPVVDRHTPISGRMVESHVRNYEFAPLDRSFPPPADLRAEVSGIACIVTSTLSRSLESAEMLAPARELISDPLFNEAGIPTVVPLNIKLPPRVWGAILRVLWFFGFSPGVESLSEAQSRARVAATRLIELAAIHHEVAFVGHGMLNTLIARALRQKGWRGSGSPRAYWGRVRLVKQD